MNKKGEGMTTGAIVAIVLALVVLVVFIMGFTGSWKNLWEKMTGFVGGANIDSIVQACQVACTTNSKYDFCEKIRNIKFNDDKQEIRKVELSCGDLVRESGKNILDPEDRTRTIRIPEIELECDIDCSGSSVFEAGSQNEFSDFISECEKSGIKGFEVDKDCDKLIINFKGKRVHTVTFKNNVAYCCRK